MIESLKRVRDQLEDADYTVAGVRELLGPVAGGALARDEIVPALRRTSGGSALETLIRLLWLQVPVSPCGALTDDLIAAGLAEWSAEGVRARTIEGAPMTTAADRPTRRLLRPRDGMTFL